LIEWTERPPPPFLTAQVVSHQSEPGKHRVNTVIIRNWR
jgi:hypothetical protein